MIDPATAAAIRQLAPSLNEVRSTTARRDRRVVPNETIGRELVLALTAAPRRTIELLDETGLLPHVLPELEACKGIEQFAKYHPEGDVFVHTLDVLERLASNATLTLIVAALCHDLGKAAAVQVKVLSGPRARERVTIRQPEKFFAAGRAGRPGGYDPATMQVQHIGHEVESERLTRALTERLVLTPYVDRDEVLHAVRHHLLQNLDAMRPSKAERILFRPDGSVRSELLELARIDPTPPTHGRYEQAVARVEQLTRARGEHTAARAPAPLLTGRDLVNAGFVPGPMFAHILSAVRDEQLRGQLTTTKSALAWVRTRFGSSRAAATASTAR